MKLVDWVYAATEFNGMCAVEDVRLRVGTVSLELRKTMQQASVCVARTARRGG